MLSLIPKKSIYFENEEFTLVKGDSFRLLKKIEQKSIDMVFADPPYFLSSGGISCSGGKQVSVDKGDWDKSLEITERLKYHRKWIRECRKVLKDNGAKEINVKELGQKELAYEIKDFKSGYYYLINLQASDDKAIKEFDRLALISNDIVRHLITTIEA